MEHFIGGMQNEKHDNGDKPL